MTLTSSSRYPILVDPNRASLIHRLKAMGISDPHSLPRESNQEGELSRPGNTREASTPVSSRSDQQCTPSDQP